MRRAWQLTGPGGPDAFALVTTPLPEVRPGWVRIAVESFGLNRSELFSRKGLSSPDFSFPRVLGLECVGRVDDGSDSELEAGARVIALMGGMGRSFDGGYATHALVPRSQVFRAPEGVSSEELGAVPETYNTAYGVTRGNLRLQGHETVLVHGGTSALGMAAAEIAKDLGCTVIGTSRREAKAALLRVRSRMDHVLVDGSDLPERILAEVGPVHAVVQCIGSTAAIEACARAMPNGGRIGQVGQLSESWDADAAPRLPEGVTTDFTRSDLVRAPDDDAAMAEILAASAEGRWRPNIHQVFAFEELPEAHRVMEANEAVGKLVVRVEGGA